MALEFLEICQICECCFELFAAIGQSDGKSPSAAENSGTKQARREARAEKRGFALIFDGRRIANIRFLRGAASGELASNMSERDLLRMVAAEPGNRPLRLAISRYRRNLRQGRIGPPPVVQR